jgi:hypothetical protein
MNCKASEIPPLGLRPRFIVDERRAIEIVEAMTRYVENAKPIPNEWLAELTEINKRLADRKPVTTDQIATQTGLDDLREINYAGAPPSGAIRECAAEIIKNMSETRNYGSAPEPEWREKLKLRAVQFQGRFGTVRVKHLMFLSTRMQELRDIYAAPNGEELAKAFMKLMDADEAIRDATGFKLAVETVVKL